jgi:hemolysin III
LKQGADSLKQAAVDAVKPRLRGVLHQYSFFVCLVSGLILVLAASAELAKVASAVYAAALAGLFGVSALYHCVTWPPRARGWMRRLDHSMIFLLIAGTYTPIALLVLPRASKPEPRWDLHGWEIEGSTQPWR